MDNNNINTSLSQEVSKSGVISLSQRYEIAEKGACYFKNLIKLVNLIVSKGVKEYETQALIGKCKVQRSFLYKTDWPIEPTEQDANEILLKIENRSLE